MPRARARGAGFIFSFFSRFPSHGTFFSLSSPLKIRGDEGEL